MTSRPAADDTEVSIGQLVASIKDDLAGLVRGEVELAKAELRDEARAAGLGGAMIVLAGLLGFFALVLFSIALVYAVDALGLTRGWAYVAVGGGYLLLAGLLALVARGRFAQVKGPQRARASVARAAEALRPSRQP